MENLAKENVDRGLLMIEKLKKLQSALSDTEYKVLMEKHQEVLSNTRDFILGIQGEFEYNWFSMFRDEPSQSKNYFASLAEEEKDILCRALVAELLL